MASSRLSTLASRSESYDGSLIKANAFCTVCPIGDSLSILVISGSRLMWVSSIVASSPS